VTASGTTDAPRHDLPEAEERIVETLIEEHVHVSCELLPLDEHTWAIRGSIAVDGEIIVAEFDERADAEIAVEELAIAEHDTDVR
jgi:hypothetical protein